MAICIRQSVCRVSLLVRAWYATTPPGAPLRKRRHDANNLPENFMKSLVQPSAIVCLVGVVALGLLVYLVVAMLKPEAFS